MERGLGHHGGFQGACASCHVEHRGRAADLLGLDREAFNHEQALFPLRGAHVEVECDECHLRVSAETQREAFHPIGAPHERCADCHADPHGATFAAGRDCVACHSEGGWSARFLVAGPEAAQRGFSHDRDTRWPLAGAHARLACGACHGTDRKAAAQQAGLAPGRGTPLDCAGCHDDPHRSALGSDCARCHGAEAWKGPGAIFDHAAHTRFPLDALHAGLSCTSCHSDGRFQSTGRECADCHRDAAALLAGRFAGSPRDPDVHAARLSCRDCHPAGLARPEPLDYERGCAGCHTPEYGTLLASRRRLLHDTAMRAEDALRRIASRADGPPGPERARVADEIDRLARSGAHHPDLAEQQLRAWLERLEPVAKGERAWKN
jgi:hypothetical protein